LVKSHHSSSRSLRVTHAPVNTAGIPWDNVQALRRRGVDARLVVFERYRLHPEADEEIRRPRGFVRRQAVQAAALARLLPRTDVFHFYFGLTVVPRRVQFPILRAARRKSVLHFLGSDIRGKSPAELAYARHADARIVGSYDAIRWVPDAEVIPPGVDLAALRQVPPPRDERPLFVHAPSSRARKGTEEFVRACKELGVELEIVEGLHHAEARKRYEQADVVLDQLNAGWYGLLAIEAMALGKPVVTFLHDEAARQSEEAFGMRVPIVRADRANLVETLRPLAESAEERRRIGAQSRAYAERAHDLEQVADRLLALYARL
jgi:glycosyltransferase involved in cell wall biosynthesis